MAVDSAHWQERLELLAEKHGMVGAVLGILVDGEVTAVATGFCNNAEGIEATPDALFQIGSISKLWTATQVMQLVDEGRVDLDALVTDYLPGVSLPADGITVRQLLSHTSGIDGDHFLDTGRGDDVLERYAATLADVKLNHPVGATMSYCNAGYSLLGRLVEVLDGKLWDTALRDRLVTPLGLSRTWTLPDDVIRFRAAVGHLKGADGGLAPVSEWGMFRSSGPAGLINSSVAELLAFVRMHLDGGVAADGTRVLSAESVAAMQQPQVDLPDRWILGKHWGLGWIVSDWDGEPVVGHDGSTLGQNAFMNALPQKGIAVALLANGGKPADFRFDLFGEVFEAVAGVQIAPRLQPDPDLDYDPEEYAGVYERAGSRFTVRAAEGGGLEMLNENLSAFAEALGAKPVVLPLTPALPGTFLATMPGMETQLPATFYDVPGGGRYLHLGARATPKVS